MLGASHRHCEKEQSDDEVTEDEMSEEMPRPPDKSNFTLASLREGAKRRRSNP